MKRDELIEFNLKAMVLKIKTNTTLTAGHNMRVNFFNSQGVSSGFFSVSFSALSEYQIGNCMVKPKPFLSILPIGKEREWSLNKTDGLGAGHPKLIVGCNDKTVLDIVLSDSVCDFGNWSMFWSRDVDQIQFPSSDNASVKYYIKPGTIILFLFLFLPGTSNFAVLCLFVYHRFRDYHSSNLCR